MHKYKEFLNSMPEGMAIINEHQEVVFVNKALHKMLNTNPHDVDVRLLRLKNSEMEKNESLLIREKIENKYLEQKRVRVGGNSLMDHQMEESEIV